jgi:hypothetical protein
METEGKRWNERFGEWGTATHGRRITAWVVLLLLGCVMTVLLVTNPGEALSGVRPQGAVLAPVLVVLMLFLLWRELRTGDSRK